MPTSPRRPITTPAAPPPNGHYSQAVRWGDLVLTAIQLPLSPGDESPPEGLESQVRQLFANLSAILEAAGSSLDDALKVTIYLTDLAAWGAVDRIYAEIMGESRPARGVVGVSALRHGCQIAAEAIAVSGMADRG